jgi:hypothetical protein
MYGIKVHKLFQNILITWFIEESCSLTLLCILYYFVEWLWSCSCEVCNFCCFKNKSYAQCCSNCATYSTSCVIPQSSCKKVLKMWQYLGESGFLSPCWCIYCTILCTLLSLVIYDALTSVHLQVLTKHGVATTNQNSSSKIIFSAW